MTTVAAATVAVALLPKDMTFLQFLGFAAVYLIVSILLVALENW